MTKNSDALSSSPIWATVGKVGAFVSLLIALFTLYSQINPDKAKVSAVCRVADVLVRPKTPVVQAPPATPTLPTPAPSREKSGTNASSPKASTTVPAVSRPVSAEALQEWKFDEPDFAAQCEVTNIGRQEAKDVVIDLPFLTKGARVNEKLLSAPELAEKSIALGIVRPNVKIPVIVWGSRYSKYSAEREEGYSLSFSGGVGAVYIPHMTFGWIADVASFLEFVSKNPFFILLILAPFFVSFIVPLVVSWLRKSKETVESKGNAEASIKTPLLAPPTGKASEPTEIVQVVVPRFGSASSTGNLEWRD